MNRRTFVFLESPSREKHITNFQVGPRYNNDIAVMIFDPTEEAKFISKCSPGKIWPACFPSYDMDYSYWIDTWVWY